VWWRVRIVYIHQYFKTRAMAGGTRSLEQAKRLVADGHEVHVITADSSGPHRSLSWHTTVEEGIHVHWLPVPYSNSMAFSARLRAFLRFAALSTVRATRIGGDVVFATSTPLTVAIPGIIASRLRRSRFVFEVRDLWPELPIEMGALRNRLAVRLAFALARAAYHDADHVVALSPGMAAGVAAHGYPSDRISVVPNASDLDLFADADQAGARFRAEHAWLGHRPLVVYLGTFGQINGVSYLARVAAKAARIDPDVRFLCVGSGAEVEQVRRLATELGVLDRNLFILPAAPKSEMPAILGAATIATSLFIPVKGMEANSANKFFDALAAARPVAINYGGWQAELLHQSFAGIVLDPYDIASAAKQLTAQVRDETWLEQARLGARALACTNFSRDLLFQKLRSAVTGELTTFEPLEAEQSRPRPTAAASELQRR
jgi:glycosyltransferase involved in cell wall biosynthesis